MLIAPFLAGLMTAEVGQSSVLQPAAREDQGGTFAPGGLNLRAGESIHANGHRLLLRGDCSLVLTDDAGRVIWKTNIAAQPCAYPTLSYRPDGVLALNGSVYGTQRSVWSVDTSGSALLELVSDVPYLAILNPDRSLAWSPSSELASFSGQLAAAIGFGDPSYSELVSASSPAPAADGDVVDRGIAANGRSVSLVIKAPVVSHVYRVPQIGKTQSPLEYFADAVANAGNQALVQFPKNQVYNFGAIDCLNGGDPQYTAAYWQINNAKDMVIDGDGSTLNFASPCQGIVLNGVERIVLKNFVIDWPKLAIAGLGTITATGGDANTGYTYDLQLDPSYAPSNTARQIAAVSAWDSEHGYWSLDYPQEDVSYGGGNLPSLTSAGTAAGVTSYGVAFEKGRHVLVRYSLPGAGPAVTIGSGSDITFQAVTLYSSPEVGFFMNQGRGMRIDHCTVTRSNDRPISLFADAVHISGQVGGDVVVENSVFAYQGDDGFNINTPLLNVGTGAGNDQVSVPGWFTPAIGDALGLFDPRLEFDKNSPPLLVTHVTANSDGTNTVALNSKLPAAEGEFLADLSTPSARYIIRHNEYLHNRARGVLLQSAFGLIEDNIFVGQTLFPIYLVSSTYWGEGAGAQDLLVLDNKIANPGRGGGLAAVVVAREDSSATPVYVPRATPGNVPPTPPIHQNLIFAGNRIEHTPGAAFYLSSANNVVLYRNTLSDTVQSPVPNVINTAPVIDVPIVVNDASHVWLEGNSFPGWRVGRDPIATDPNTTIGVTVLR